MNIRVIYNCLLVRLGIRKVLPIDYIRSIRIHENQEPFVRLSSDILCGTRGPYLARVSVIAKLERIAAKLKKEHNLSIMVYELYRSPVNQQSLRNKRIELVQMENAALTQDEILSKVNKEVSSVGGGHQAGGAVDLVICTKDGIPLDMGTKYDEFNAFTATYSKGLPLAARRNREMLLRYMRQEGFVNYPNEWWHFSYGDRMWAAYSRKKCAIYDVVTNINNII